MVPKDVRDVTRTDPDSAEEQGDSRSRTDQPRNRFIVRAVLGHQPSYLSPKLRL
jgi:hypothetical protein